MCESRRRFRVSPRRLLDQLLRHFSEEFRLPRPHDTSGDVEVVVDPCRPRPRAYLLRPPPSLGVQVGDDKPLDLAGLLDEHVDRTPVREIGHGKGRELLEGSLEIERRGEQSRRLVEERESLAQHTLGHGQLHPLERKRGLPRERELQRTALRRELLVRREREGEPADRTVPTHERQADEPVAGLRPADEFGVAAVAFLLRADEDALAGSHRLRQRVVAGDREAAERVDVPAVVAPRRDHVEPLAVLAQHGDQAAAGVGGAHGFDEHRVEHVLRCLRRDQRFGDELHAESRVERVRPRRGLLLRTCSRTALAGEHLAAEDPSQDEDSKRDRALGLDRPRVVRHEEEVVERDDRDRCRRQSGATPAERGREEHDEDVEQRRQRFVRVAEGKQGDCCRAAERDDSPGGGAQRGPLQPLGVRPEREHRGPAGHPALESSRLSWPRSPLAMRSSTSRTSPARWSGSNGLTT